jgi:hypothetical protein
MEHKVDTRHLGARKEQIAVRLRNGAKGSPNGMPGQLYQDSTVEQAIQNSVHAIPDYYGLYDGAGLGAQVGYTQNPVDYGDGGVIPRGAVAKPRKRDMDFVDVDLASAATSGVHHRSPVRNEALRQAMISEVERFIPASRHGLTNANIEQIDGYIHNLFAKQVALRKAGTPMVPLAQIKGDGGSVAAVPQTVVLESKPIIDSSQDDDDVDPNFINVAVIDTGDRIKMQEEIERFLSPAEHGLTGVSSIQEYELTIHGIADQQRAHYVEGAPAPVRERSLADADVFAETMADVAMMSDDELRTKAPVGEYWGEYSRKEMIQRFVRITIEAHNAQAVVS